MPMQAAGKPYDPRVDAHIAKAPVFAVPILEHFRALVHTAVPDATEDIKWGRAFFLRRGEPMCFMAAFKQHCAIGFWSPKMVEVLRADGIDGVGTSGSMGKILSITDLPAKAALTAYLVQAAKQMDVNSSSSAVRGSRETRSRKPSLPLPDDLRDALAQQETAQQNFEALPPSCRREYIEWVLSAKRKETRVRRVTAAAAMVAEGRRFNDQYR